jgi:poly-gamma-glutamate synthesis protein (capsule biosynthesis protein)
MIIIGDIASPTPFHSLQLGNVFTGHHGIFGNNNLICNFEGLINDEVDLNSKTPVLFNHSSVLSALSKGNLKAVGLANNHILDLPESYTYTVEKLALAGFSFTGASLIREEAIRPASFFDGDKQVFLFNYCWDFLLYHQNNPTKGIHIAILNERKLIKMIIDYRKEFPDAALIVLLHWSFDLETLPFPMYRQFSRKLIDKGANVIAGAHSHCVQGGEKYKDGYIVYGLGNFFLPYKTFTGSYLTFPDFARIQLAFEWDSTSSKAICHWFEYNNDQNIHTLKHISSDDFESSVLLKKHSPFKGLSDKVYIEYFRKHCRKKFLIPIYIDYNNILRNRMYTIFLKNRARFVRMLAGYRIIKWQR